jgi:hypothetical protein
MIHVACVNARNVCFHTTRSRAIRTASLSTGSFGDEGSGIGVALSQRVTRIRSSSHDIERTAGGSLVLLTAGPTRPRAATADALRRPPLTRSRRRHADAPAVMPHLIQDDGRFRFTAKLFIVFRSAPRGDRLS